MFNVQFIKYVHLVSNENEYYQLQFEHKLKSPIEPKIGWTLVDDDFVEDITQIFYDVKQSVLSIPVDPDTIKVPPDQNFDDIVQRMKDKYTHEGWSFVAEKDISL